eukprot:SAG11_NODE_34569_length_271_cov_0.604651_1_plen_79_part_01
MYSGIAAAVAARDAQDTTTNVPMATAGDGKLHLTIKNPHMEEDFQNFALRMLPSAKIQELKTILRGSYPTGPHESSQTL